MAVVVVVVEVVAVTVTVTVPWVVAATTTLPMKEELEQQLQELSCKHKVHQTAYLPVVLEDVRFRCCHANQACRPSDKACRAHRFHREYRLLCNGK